MTTQAWMWTAAVAALALAWLAGAAERRRSTRRELDDPGWAPWRGIQVAAVFAILLFAVLALKAS